MARETEKKLDAASGKKRKRTHAAARHDEGPREPKEEKEKGAPVDLSLPNQIELEV